MTVPNTDIGQQLQDDFQMCIEVQFDNLKPIWKYALPNSLHRTGYFSNHFNLINSINGLQGYIHTSNSNTNRITIRGTKVVY